MSACVSLCHIPSCAFLHSVACGDRRALAIARNASLGRAYRTVAVGVSQNIPCAVRAPLLSPCALPAAGGEAEAGKGADGAAVDGVVVAGHTEVAVDGAVGEGEAAVTVLAAADQSCACWAGRGSEAADQSGSADIGRRVGLRDGHRRTE